MATALALDRRRPSMRARLFAVIALAPLLVLPSLGHAAPITVPTSLLPGQQYRLAFVTAGTRDATSSSIADYDAFVTAEANTEVALSSISWQVLGSTAAVSARDHTGTAPANYPGVPIFLLNDVKLVDDYADLWDGSVDTPLAINQHGADHREHMVWTGTYYTGVGLPQALGQFSTITGSTGSIGGQLFGPAWIYGGDRQYGLNLYYYAMSEVLSVPVPEPRPTALLTLDFAALLLLRRLRLF